MVGRQRDALRNTSKFLPMCDSNSSLADLQAEVAALEAEQEADNKVLARLKADKAARDARLYALRAEHEPETIFNLTALPAELLLGVLRECTTARSLAACAQVCILLRDAIGGCDDLWMRHLFQHRSLYVGWDTGLRRWWLCAVSHIPEGSENKDPLTHHRWHRIALPSPLCVTKHCVLLRELSAKESLIASRIDARRPCITEEELCGLSWSIKFPPGMFGGGERVAWTPACFHRDGVYEDSAFFRRHQGRGDWTVTVHNQRDGTWHQAVSVAGAGPHLVRRQPDGSWHIENHVIRLSSGKPWATRVNGCVIVGLQSRPELNGRRCAVVEFDESRGRYKAYLDADKPPDLLPDGNMVSYTGPRYHPATHHCEGLLLKPTNVVLPVGSRVVILIGGYREREGRIVSSLIREGSMQPSAEDFVYPHASLLGPPGTEMHDRLVREFAERGIPVRPTTRTVLDPHETTTVEEDAGYDIEFRDHDSTGPPITHTFVDPNAPDAPSRVGDWAVADVYGVENKEHEKVDKKFVPEPEWFASCYNEKECSAIGTEVYPEVDEDGMRWRRWNPALSYPHGRRVLLRGVPREACILAIGPPLCKTVK